ncbi:hypothetical protein Y694_04010 [Methylibium sp. T29-B]|nr:hypothetical protein Y694_04010 [Methylibium sp. T29-B]
MAHALLARRVQGLEDREARIEAGQETPLQLAFPVFVLGLAVQHDAGTDAQPARAQTVGRGRAQGQRADRHRQAEVAAGPVRRCGRQVDPADGATVQAAWRAFQPGDQLHRVVLGGAGDRAAGKHGAQHRRQVGAGCQLGTDRRGHLEHGGMRLHLEQLRHLHRAGAGDATEVVAQQVDDHQVLGAVLGVQAQQPGGLAVAFEHRTARRRALHRLGDEPALRMADEQLRRARQHVCDAARGHLVGRQRDEGAIGHRLARTQPAVERDRRAVGLEVQPVGVVDLVGLAGADGLVDVADRGVEGGAVHAGLHVQRAGRARLGRALPRGQPVPGLVGRQPPQFAEHQYAQRGPGVAGAATGLQQLRAPFVVGQQHRVQAGALVGLDRAPHRVERGRILAAVRPHMVRVEPAARPLRGRRAVVQQRKGLHVVAHRHSVSVHAHSFSQPRRPSAQAGANRSPPSGRRGSGSAGPPASPPSRGSGAAATGVIVISQRGWSS